MKKTLTFCLLLISVLSLATTRIVNGVIKDATTLIPIESVSIRVENSNLGAISNSEGKFRLVFSGDFNAIQFSHLNYHVFVQTLKTGENEVEIFLEPKSFQLSEVIVRSKPVKELLSDAMKISKEKLEKSIVLNTYYREFVKVNDEYTSFSDGLLDYNIKRKSGASDLYVNQCRAIKLTDVPSSEREKNRESFYLYDVRDAVREAYNFKIINYILKSKSYDFEIETKTDDKGNSIEIVTILPKEDAEFHLYTGTVVFDGKSKLILEMDIRKSPKHKMYALDVDIVFLRFKVYEEERKASYRIEGEKYILVYNQNKLNAYINFKGDFEDTFEFMSDMVVSDYKEGEFDFDRSKRHKERSLFSAGNHFTEEFWKTNNSILLNEAEEKILSKLN
ncbi:MAG TPA: carboxypeptidase-like regulatory domain-containing protein [Flavobacterium sp.]|uniref:carboxypeptidase-like regulatory domain-containing protein n=1 Tax=Flavobacterium sp. TaxID=239 RepID=UPI002D00CA4B|nr:carboxypeptidase-like regulatory domain-containing protein [Flavobacterium sp.]HSD15060.1 carboxypeptidase-like regulatory domain-containing protein [Flavobacterium sp.]